mmetsp:Transcript_7085/g.10352  ORF Transcript_7085/g.10352 Transcript_7085/m.10352 type:complete len:242 (-) Transcript_7085:626-1351(-)
MLTLKSLTILSLTIFLYFKKFSGLICFLISSSLTPLSRISVIMTANFSLAWFVTSVSGTCTSNTSERASERALLRAGVNSLASSASTALRNSSCNDSAVKPARTLLANSSVTSGRVRWEASKISMSKRAVLPANVLSRRFTGNVTLISRLSPTEAPMIPSTRPSMYRPFPIMTSTSSPDAAFGRGSPLVPSSLAMYPTMFTRQASPSPNVVPSGAGARVAYRSRKSFNALSNFFWSNGLRL